MTVTDGSERRSVAAFWILAALFVAAVASSAIPSPLYPVYAAEWQLAPVTLTIVFAIYVVGLLLMLVVAGSLSDFIGRKPVLAVGVVLAVAAMALFATADSLGMLIAARVLQGVAVGTLMGALGAGLLDHSLPKHPSWASVLNGAIPPLSLTIGALSSGALVEWAPWPTGLVYVVFGAFLLLAGLALFVVPERVQRRPGALASLRPTVSLPAASRTLFSGVVWSLVSSWALVGLYLALMPSVLKSAFAIDDHFAVGAFIAVFTAAGAITGLAIQRADARRAMLLGLVALILGPLVTVIAVPSGLLIGVLVGTVIAGIGFGAGFQAGLRLLLSTAVPESRARLLSVIYIASYLAFGLPSVVAGALQPLAGIVPVTIGYGVFVMLCASVSLIAQLRPGAAERAEERASARVASTATGSVIVVR
ncbi:MFS transporter [Microbacteriaceae bacterium VKM Ac-2854]|nr:MFS transporter [Microbacteriaceae bacterium VKM Ac-2854]